MTNYAFIRIFLFSLALNCLAHAGLAQTKDPLILKMTDTVNGVLGKGVFNVTGPVKQTAERSGYAQGFGHEDTLVGGELAKVFEGFSSFMGAEGTAFIARFDSKDNIKSFEVTVGAKQTVSIGTVAQQLGLVMPIKSLHIPDNISNGLSLSKFSIKFDGEQAGPLTANFKLSNNWQPFENLQFLLSGLHVNFSLPKPDSKNIIGELGATYNLNNAKIAFTAPLSPKPENWVINGQITNLNVGDIFSIFGLNNIDKAYEWFLGIGIQSGAVEIHPHDQMARVLAQTKLGNFDLAVKHSSNQWGAMAGFTLPTGFKFSSVLHELRFLDGFQLDNAGIVVSTITDKIDSGLPLFQKLAADSLTINQGLTFLIRQDCQKGILKNALSLLGGHNKLNDVLFTGNLPPNLNDFTAKATVDFSKAANINEVIYFKDFSLQAKPLSTDPQFSFLGDIDIRLNNNTLQFEGKIGVGVATQSLILGGALKNTWNKPFGIPNLSVDSLSLEVGITFESDEVVGIPLPIPDEIALSGGMKLGNFSGNAALAFDATDPTKCMLDVAFGRLGIMDVINNLCSPQIIAKIPSYVGPYLNASLENVELKFVPPPGFTTLANQYFSPGFTVKGAGEISSWKGAFVFDLEGSMEQMQGGLTAKATMAPIKIEYGGNIIFQISGSTQHPGAPELFLNLSSNQLIHLNKKDTILYVNASINILGAKADTYLNLVPAKGFVCKMEGKLYNILDASLEASINNFSQEHLPNATITVSGNLGKITQKLQSQLSKVLTDHAFSIENVYMSGKLQALKTGGKLTVDYKLAGRSGSLEIDINFGDIDQFFKKLAEALLRDCDPIIKEIKRDAAIALDAAKDWFHAGEESVKNVWNKFLNEGEKVISFAKHFGHIHKGGDDKLIKVSGPQYRIFTKNGYVVARGSAVDQFQSFGENDIFTRNFFDYARPDSLTELWQFIPAQEGSSHRGYFFIVSSLDGRNFNETGNNMKEDTEIKLRKHRTESPSNERMMLIPVGDTDPGYYYINIGHNNDKGWYVGIQNSFDANEPLLHQFVRETTKVKAAKFRIESAGKRVW